MQPRADDEILWARISGDDKFRAECDAGHHFEWTLISDPFDSEAQCLEWIKRQAAVLGFRTYITMKGPCACIFRLVSGRQVCYGAEMCVQNHEFGFRSSAT